MSTANDQIHDPSLSQSPVLLTVDELSELLKVSKRTIWRMRSSGQIPKPVRIGGGVRWRQSEIENWIKKGCPDQLNMQNGRKG